MFLQEDSRSQDCNPIIATCSKKTIVLMTLSWQTQSWWVISIQINRKSTVKSVENAGSTGLCLCYRLKSWKIGAKTQGSLAFDGSDNAKIAKSPKLPLRGSISLTPPNLETGVEKCLTNSHRSLHHWEELYCTWHICSQESVNTLCYYRLPCSWLQGRVEVFS